MQPRYLYGCLLNRDVSDWKSRVLEFARMPRTDFEKAHGLFWHWEFALESMLQDRGSGDHSVKWSVGFTISGK